MPKPLEVYEELKSKIGEKEAKDLVEFVQESIEKGAATKEDIHRLEIKMEAIKSDLLKEIAGLYKWLFGFWITLLIAILLKELIK